MVKEIEDLKAMIGELKGEISYLKVLLFCYEKEIEGMKNVVVQCEREEKECIGEVWCFKNLMVCGISMVVFYYVRIEV